VPQHNVPALAGRNIRCILFDLGATLWIQKEDAISPTQEQATQQQILAILRQHIAPHFFPKTDDLTLGTSIATVIDQRVYEMYLLDAHIEPDFAQAVIEALQQLGFPSLDRTIGTEIFEVLRVRSYGSRMLFEDALSTLAALKQRGFLLGVVTNRQYGGPLFIEDMENFGLLDYFEERTVAISTDLGVRKPNAKIFMYALDALNVSPTEAVMVGDSLAADVVGAKQLNMIAVWKPNPLLFTQVRVEQGAAGQDQQAFTCLLFKSARQFEKTRGRPIPEDIAPDLIIERLSELLDVFANVGRQ